VIPAGLWAMSALIGIAFTVRIGIRFWRTGKPHHAAWFVGFALYTFAALASALADSVGWNPWLYKLWYVAAAALVAFLGAGELYFVARPRWAHAFLGAMVLVALAMLVKALTVPVDLARLGAGGEIGGEALPGSVRLFSPLLTIPGSLALIGGGAVVGPAPSVGSRSVGGCGFPYHGQWRHVDALRDGRAVAGGQFRRRCPVVCRLRHRGRPSDGKRDRIGEDGRMTPRGVGTKTRYP